MLAERVLRAVIASVGSDLTYDFSSVCRKRIEPEDNQERSKLKSYCFYPPGKLPCEDGKSNQVYMLDAFCSCMVALVALFPSEVLHRLASPLMRYHSNGETFSQQ